MSLVPLTSRRGFLKRSGAGLAGALIARATAPSYARTISPNEKLNLGLVGVGGRGGDNMLGVKDQNIVALCDVDRNRLNAAAAQFPAAKTYKDYRRLLEQGDIDAVVVSTPDHAHAVIVCDALKSGRHMYCEKPLAHTISETRQVAELAHRTGLTTQLGNQIHSERNYRRVVELVQSGAIGEVREAHHWVGGGWEIKPPPSAEPVPAHLDYDLWVGPALWRDYSSEWVPYKWRGWWHWGGGTLADFCCHHIDLGLWALQLGLPTRVEAEGPPADAHCAPPWLIVRYEFPGRRVAHFGERTDVELPPVRLTWYNGGKRPPQFAEGKLPEWHDGSLFVGSKGLLLADYRQHVLLPAKDFESFQPPSPFIPDSPGQHQEWIRAVKGQGTALCHFGYGAQLTEIGLLGNVAYRVGKPLEWDARNLRATGCPEADRFVHYEYRKGWTL